MSTFPSSSTGQTRRTFDEMTERAKQGSEVVRHEAGDLVSKTKQTADDLMHYAGEAFGHWRESASEYADQGRQKMQAFGRTLEGQVHQRPATALVLATGVGFLAAYLWMRR